jgi:hypothetical protein
MPRETQPTPWTTLIIMAVIILYSIVIILYLTVTGRITTLLPVLVGNVTVSQGSVLKVTVMAFGATFKITGITPLGGVACRLTGVFINNTQALLTPPWVLRSGQSVVFVLSDCTNVSQVIVSYDNGKVLVIPVRG